MICKLCEYYIMIVHNHNMFHKLLYRCRAEFHKCTIVRVYRIVLYKSTVSLLYSLAKLNGLSDRFTLKQDSYSLCRELSADFISLLFIDYLE